MPLLNHYTYRDVATILGERRMRKIANNLYAARPTWPIINRTEIHVSYFSLHIAVLMPNGEVYVKPSDSLLALNRVNRFLPLGYSIFDADGDWYVHRTTSTGKTETLMAPGQWNKLTPYLTLREV